MRICSQGVHSKGAFDEEVVAAEQPGVRDGQAGATSSHAGRKGSSLSTN